jgi:molecular chaperone DnaK
MSAYGIDLGTTYSCVANIDDTGKAVVLKNAVGEDTTPSVVYFESPDNVVVGRAAKDSAILAPDLVASLVKRNMGENDVHWTYHGQDQTPESVSALILRELARAAGDQTHETVTDVVITVPAYFGLAEREATRRAGKMAGLNVLDVLAEPVAAALHYQANAPDQSGKRYILVYDLGGGTFDTTVIELSGDDVQVVCTDGDHRLGGADWDAKIMDFLLESFAEQQPDIDPAEDEQGMQDLAATVERTKKDLSQTQSRKITMRFGGKVVPVELTRTKLEELTQLLLDQTMDITERTIKVAKEKGVDHFDDVLLVGGMTKMPTVGDTLRSKFGLDPKTHEPDLAVAKGAALYAVVQKVKVSMPEDASPEQTRKAVRAVADQLGMSVEQVEELANKKVATVVPRAFGIKVTDLIDPSGPQSESNFTHSVEHLLTANTALPSDTGPQEFCTLFDNQTQVRLEVWEQAGSNASPELEYNTHIGEGLLTNLPPRPKGAPFDVTFVMNETGLLKVHAVEQKSGREVRFEIQIGGMTDEQVKEAGDAVARFAVSG